VGADVLAIQILLVPMALHLQAGVVVEEGAFLVFIQKDPQVVQV
jgi:hypothetical protein